MKKIVVATTNQNKVKRMKALLKNLDYEIVSLSDVSDKKMDEPKEIGLTPTDIAIEKALHYLKYLPNDTIVLSQDDTLVMEGIKEEDNPGMHIKKPVVEKYGKFTDEFAAEYYRSLAEKYGGTIPVFFKYGHAIAIKTTGERTITKVVSAESILKLKLVNKIYKLEKTPGYFLAALLEANINGKWIPYNDLDEDVLVKLDSDLYKSICTLLKNL